MQRVRPMCSVLPAEVFAHTWPTVGYTHDGEVNSQIVTPDLRRLRTDLFVSSSTGDSGLLNHLACLFNTDLFGCLDGWLGG